MIDARTFIDNNSELTDIHLAFDLTEAEILTVMDRDLAATDHLTVAENTPELHEVLLTVKGVTEVDYHGMFARHAIFVKFDVEDAGDIAEAITKVRTTIMAYIA